MPGNFRNLIAALAMLNVAAALMLFFGAEGPAPTQGKLTNITRKEDLLSVTVQMTPSPPVKIRITQEVGGGQVYFQMHEPLRARCTGESLNGIATALYGLDRKAMIKRDLRGPDPQYGLDKPELILEWTDAERKGNHVLKVGGQDPLSGARYFKIDADEDVYLMARETYESFTRAPEKYEDLTLGEFEPTWVFKIEGDRKILVVGPGGVRTEREKMVLEPIPGTDIWQVQHPEIIKGEPGDLTALTMMMQALIDLRALEFVADTGNPKDFGMDDPEMVLSLHVKQRDGSLAPRTYTFGKVERPVPDKPNEKETTVYLKGGWRERIARIDENTLNGILGGLGFDGWRYRYVFDYQKTDILAIAVHAPDIGDFEIVRTPPDAERVYGRWQVVQPAGIQADDLTIDHWVENFLLRQSMIQEFLDRDPKVTPLGEKPTVVTIRYRRTYETKPSTRYYSFAADPDAEREVGYAQKQGLKQVFQVNDLYVEILNRLELSIAPRVAYDCDRETIAAVKIDVEERVGPQQEPVKWGYAFKHKPDRPCEWDGPPPPAHFKTLAACESILDFLNRIPAAEFVTRRKGQLAKYGLDAPMIRVEFGIDENRAGDVDLHEVLLISSARADRGGKIYGMIESRGVVFELRPEDQALFKQ